MNYIFFTTAWGAKYGGINAFNRDFTVGLSKEIKGNAKVYCITPWAEDNDIIDAKNNNVILKYITKEKKEDEFKESHFFDCEKILLEEIGEVGNIVWCGHDVFSSDIAIAFYRKYGGKLCIFHHMRYSYYESYKKTLSPKTDEKINHQHKIFTECDNAIYFAVGPLLSHSCEQIANKKCTTLIPGFPEFKFQDRSPNDSMEILTSGRMEQKSNRIKQASLTAKGFGRAIKDAEDLPDVFEIWFKHPNLTILGINADDMSDALRLKEYADTEADRATNVSVLPYDTDRIKLFNRLNATNLFVMPSLHEGFGLTGWEAIAAEVPLILSKDSGLYKLINEHLPGKIQNYVKSIDIKGGIQKDEHEEDIKKISNALRSIGSDIKKWKENAKNLKKDLMSTFNNCTWRQTARLFIQALDPKPALSAHRDIPRSIQSKNLAIRNGHKFIRSTELGISIRQLNSKRVVWVISSPKMGEKEFISNIIKNNTNYDSYIYYFDMSGCSTKLQFLEKFRLNYGIDFNEAIVDIFSSKCFIVFENISSNEEKMVCEEISSIIVGITQLTKIIIKSNNISFSESDLSYDFVKLNPLNEIDFKAYVINSSDKKERFFNEDTLSKLSNLTKNTPEYIDSALKRLNFTSIDNLMDEDPFGYDKEISTDKISETIKLLSDSTDKDKENAYKLLLALLAFPYGVQFDDIKRFYGTKGLFSTHAMILKNLSLIDSLPQEYLNTDYDQTYIEYIYIPMHIIETIKDHIDDMYRKALPLCFGPNWSIGKISNTQFIRKILQPHIGDNEFKNCSEILFKLLQIARSENDKSTENSIIRLIVSFSKLLRSSNRFNNGVSFCREALAFLQNPENNIEIAHIRSGLASFLRMMGRERDAIDECNNIDISFISDRLKQSIMLTEALSYDDLGESEEALSVAKKLMKIDRNTSSSLHAQYLIAKKQTDKGKMLLAFSKILRKSKKENYTTLSQNIMLEMYDRGDKSLKSEIRRSILSNKGENYYNFARGLSAIFSNSEDNKSRSDIIKVYHFLWSQRIFPLFNKYHKILWEIFESEGDIPNLANLFCQSSFVWRLTDKSEQERIYLEKIQEHLNIDPMKKLSINTSIFTYLDNRYNSLILPKKVE
ncbi:glycosyltransferase [Gluconobacter kondonii]|uniref:glycosyltransferase n=1 Tax=Gluconobacter kondonii TaxID=941463 RepID=UPI001B8CF7A7|nr:glycosyltransferase [Gluconobacter kondonii]MBS1066902.1 glycosyltransferase [Gluconobacter kondonii]